MKKVSETGKHNTLDYEERAGNYIDFAEDMFEQYYQTSCNVSDQLFLFCN